MTAGIAGMAIYGFILVTVARNACTVTTSQPETDMQNVHALAQATLAARKASGVEFCTRASKGRVQAGYFMGKTFIDMSDWMTIEQATEWMLGLAEQVCETQGA